MLRYFIAVAEELHLTRAAERLGIEQSAVSRAMRDLENQLGVVRTQQTFGVAELGLPSVPRRMLARAGYRGAGSKERQGGVTGLSGQLRIAICDSLAHLVNEPELEIRVFELPFAQQLKVLHNDPLSAIGPARHPLLAHVQVPLAEALKFPLVLYHPLSGSGRRDQNQAVPQHSGTPVKLVEEVTSLGVMLSPVGAGDGIGFAIAS